MKRKRPGLLPPAEIEIFTHLARAPPPAARRVLGRNLHTVRSRPRNAYIKLDAHDREDALAKVRDITLTTME